MIQTAPSHNGLRDIKLATKISVIFLIVAVLFVLLGGVGIWGMHQLQANMQRTIAVAQSQAAQLSATANLPEATKANTAQISATLATTQAQTAADTTSFLWVIGILMALALLAAAEGGQQNRRGEGTGAVCVMVQACVPLYAERLGHSFCTAARYIGVGPQGGLGGNAWHYERVPV